MTPATAVAGASTRSATGHESVATVNLRVRALAWISDRNVLAAVRAAGDPQASAYRRILANQQMSRASPPRWTRRRRGDPDYRQEGLTQ